MPTTRLAIRALVLTLILGLSASALAMDLTQVPPDPAAINAALEAHGGLAKAIAIAEQAGGGKAHAVLFDLDSQSARVEVARSDSKFAVVIVSLTSGEVVSNEEKNRFPGEPVTGDWIETESGLKYFDIVVGEGDQPSGPSAQVEVHYSGYLVDGTKFDSSVDRGETITFALNRVIKGWTEGVGSMRVGGKRKLIIPASLGYGAQGAGGVIPPNATLVFDVELISLP